MILKKAIYDHYDTYLKGYNMLKKVSSIEFKIAVLLNQFANFILSSADNEVSKKIFFYQEKV